ncbi:hypothetical protein UNPF46_23940 [Bradyrhizobium sp. UNPF46]|nr:hypothetical protein UNPF46_23940 [Bradyrhizobium sp. UNPF46]
MQQRWLSAIEAGADWIQLATWNDWNEATYLEPFEAPLHNIWAVPAWQHLPDHGGFLQASRFYIDWFKTGSRPDISKDELFYFYQLHPKESLGVVDFAPVVRGRPKFADQLTDRIHFVTFLSAPAVLDVEVGGSRYKIQLPSGDHISSVPMALGNIVLALKRNQQLVTGGTLSLPVTSDATTGNFNYFSGQLKIER